MYTRNWLRRQIAGYIHDEGVSAHLDTWIDIGAKRVSQVLECWEMEAELVNSLAEVIESGVLDGGTADGGGLVLDGGDAFNSNPDAAPVQSLAIPSDVKRVLGVQVLDGEEWRNLKSIGSHAAGRFKCSGTPIHYYLEGRSIYPVPFTEGQYRAQVMQEAEVPSGDNTTDVVTAYPFLFLNAALAEAYDWKQNPQMSARYEQKWITEAQQITANYRGESGGETLAMRAI